MRILFSFVLLIAFTAVALGQGNGQILATIEGKSFSADDLDPNVKKAWEAFPSQLIRARRAFVSQFISDTLIRLEANEQKMSSEQLIAKEVSAKVPAPTQESIQAVYDANPQAVGGKTLEQVRPQIINFLRREPEQKLWLALVNRLKSKFKVVDGKDVNSATLKEADVLATVGKESISFSDFKKKYGLQLYEFEANIYDQTIGSLEKAIDSALIQAESKTLNITPREFITREVNGKMKDFSPREEELLQRDLRSRLYKKYKTSIYIKEPIPFIQTVSADDDPVQGDKNARVTLIMFTDFQCPACAAAHPVIKRVLAEYKGKVKFVVRDFPLTQIHENAFNAALSANAANKQGKFFEYAELLYDNQQSLDKASLRVFAGTAGLNLEKYEKDIADPSLAAEVRKDIKDGNSYSVNSTPSIFVNGYKIRSLSAASLRKAINRALGN